MGKGSWGVWGAVTEQDKEREGFRVSWQKKGHSTLGLRKLCPAKRASSPSSSSILRNRNQAEVTEA